MQLRSVEANTEMPCEGCAALSFSWSLDKARGKLLARDDLTVKSVFSLVFSHICIMLEDQLDNCQVSTMDDVGKPLRSSSKNNFGAIHYPGVNQDLLDVCFDVHDQSPRNVFLESQSEAGVMFAWHCVIAQYKSGKIIKGIAVVLYLF